MSETQETNPIQDLIQYSIDQNYAQASKSFGDVMTIKLNDLLDQEKIRLSDQIYNGVEDGEEDNDEEAPAYQAGNGGGSDRWWEWQCCCCRAFDPPPGVPALLPRVPER